MMKRLLIITFAAAISLACGNSEQVEESTKGEVITVGVEEFAKIISEEEVRLIDVRTPKEYAEGHLRGAVNIDVNAPDFADRIKGVDGRVAVYCRGGKRSLKAAAQLAAQVDTVYNLDGGILAWQKAGQPTTKS